MLHLLPALAILMALGASAIIPELTKKSLSWKSAIRAILLLLIIGWWCRGVWLQTDSLFSKQAGFDIPRLAKTASKSIEQDAKVICVDDTGYLYYYVDRPGWWVHNNELTIDKVKQLQNAGAEYLISYGYGALHLHSNSAKLNFA